MSQYAWNIGFAISLAISISFSLVVGRKVFKTGIERFSSRILIFSSIVNTALCSLQFAFSMPGNQ